MRLFHCLTLLVQIANPVPRTPPPGATPNASSSIKTSAVSSQIRRTVRPFLVFPEIGLDDAASYQGYQTRLYRDGAHNTLQVYIDERAARVVHIWADAENESIGFTARRADGKPAALQWIGPDPTVTGAARSRTRSFEHHLTAESAELHLGWFLLGSMRVERDFQYEERQRAPFASEPYRLREFDRLIAGLGRLDSATRRAHLALLRAKDVAALETRRGPSIAVRETATRWTATVTQQSFDGRDTVTLEFTVNPRTVRAARAGDSLVFHAVTGVAVPFAVRVTTTGGALTPLRRDEIFTAEFLKFLATTRAAITDSMSPTGLHARRLERQVRGVELLSSREKLMAGLPTYATYFGRDMLVSALMMHQIWRGAMSEAAISAALRKLSPTGEVSHEEALGGQAVREAASQYADLVDSMQRATARADREGADGFLKQATVVLRDARRTRENYHMIDDELQLPVLVARWITDPTISATQKKTFLRAAGQPGVTRLTLLLRELALVARMTAPYANNADVQNLIAFAPRDATLWSSSSWRDSGVGYANGKFAMDVNAIWAPQALESIARIIAELRVLGLPIESVARADPAVANTEPFMAWLRDGKMLDAASRRWREASQHFLVQLTPNEVRAGVAARLGAMPTGERTFWTARGSTGTNDRDSLVFLALSLDANGKPIAVANTDPSTRLFLGEREGRTPSLTPADRALALRDVRLFTTPYPVGLFVDRIGPVVSNDAYSKPAVWNAFVKDPYHGPRVIWGREVNLFLLGAAERVRGAEKASAYSTDPSLQAYARELRMAITTIHDAVNASGFHSELWSYGFSNGKLVPLRYGSGGDVQLWSTTDLAVEYALSRIAR